MSFSLLDALFAAGLAYLLGTVLGGPLLAMVFGVNLRASGSGNVGATNALRTGGLRMALPVLLIDVLKGVVAVTAIPAWLGGADASSLAYLCGVAVAVGHCYPLWTGFNGGKGVATLAGVFAVLLPVAFCFIIAVFALVVLASGYVSAASVLGALTAVLWTVAMPAASLPPHTLAFVLAMAALVVFKHRENLVRLMRGTEGRFERAALLRRWLQRRRGSG